MDRLTERHYHPENGYYMSCSGTCQKDFCDCGTCDVFSEMIQRLGTYEDTGLEPEEINKWKTALSKLTNVTGDRLLEIANAESEGRLIVLPCKVGDELWFLLDGKLRCETIDRVSLDMTDEDDIPFTRVYTMSTNLMFEDIGRLAFLTRESAEAALGGDGV